MLKDTQGFDLTLQIQQGDPSRGTAEPQCKSSGFCHAGHYLQNQPPSALWISLESLQSWQG